MIKAELIEKYKTATNKLLLLDYDGTLVDFYPFPEKATPSEKLLDLLIKLIGKPQTKIIIISGRSHQEIDFFLGHLPIDIIAEHGAMMKENGEWKKQIVDNGSWKNKVLPVLNHITSICPGLFIEEKYFSLAWHYRNVESKLGYSRLRTLIYTLENTIIQDYNLKIVDGNKVVEITTTETGKGIAVKNLVEQNDYDYILAIGDDKTDEDMFKYLLPDVDADTIKVGAGETLAKYKLGNVKEVLMLLEQLSLVG